MIDTLILPLQAVGTLLPLAVIWIGGSWAIYFFGGQSVRTYGENPNYEWLRPIGSAIQEGAVFAVLYFVGLVVLVAFTPLGLFSEPFGPIVFYSVLFAPGLPIVFAIVLYPILIVSGRAFATDIL